MDLGLAFHMYDEPAFTTIPTILPSDYLQQLKASLQTMRCVSRAGLSRIKFNPNRQTYARLQPRPYSAKEL